jgi:hypothetical protein
LGIANITDITDITDIVIDITDIINIVDIAVETGRHIQGVTKVSHNSIVKIRTKGVAASEGKIVIKLSQTIREISGRAKSYPLSSK